MRTEGTGTRALKAVKHDAENLRAEDDTKEDEKKGTMGKRESKHSDRNIGRSRAKVIDV